MREEKPAARSRRRIWIAGLTGVVLIAAVGLWFFMRARAPATPPIELGDHDWPATPVAVPVPPVPPMTIRNGRPPTAPQPFVIDPGDGLITLSTDVPARCTIRWVRFQTPVMDYSVPAGHHPAECISLDGTRRATFDVTILRNLATPRHIVLNEQVDPPQPPPPIGPSPLPRHAR
jgi:hypothetical protein